MSHTCAEPQSKATQALTSTVAKPSRRGVNRGLVVETAPLVQTKLTVNRPGDRYEREADDMAERVAQRSEAEQTAIQPRGTSASNQPARPLFGRISPFLQRKVEADHPTLPPGSIQRQEDSEEEEEAMQAKENPGQIQRQENEEEEEAAQAKELPAPPTRPAATSSGGTEGSPPPATPKPVGGRRVSGGIERSIQNRKGRGRPLEGSTRRLMESQFGVSFDAVRIHADSESTRLSRSLNAQAFTLGNDVFFHQSRYAPETPTGKRLLAHELTHVVQQNHSQIRRRLSAGASDTATATTGPSSRGGDRASAPAPSRADMPSGNGRAPDPITAPPSQDTGLRTDSRQEPSTIDQPARDKSKAASDQSAQDVDVSQKLAGADVVPEKAPPPEPLAFEGSSEARMEAFTDATASQKAVSFSSLGGSVSEQLDAEQKDVAENTPPLKAQNGGLDQLPENKAEVDGEDKKAELDDKVAAPAAPKVDSYKDLGAAPDNQRAADRQLEERPSGGFLSWFRDKFKSFMSGVATRDPGLNTKAGKSPELEDTSGDVKEKRDKGGAEVESQKKGTVQKLKDHPGQKNIQPVEVNEEAKVEITPEAKVDLATEPDEGLTDYANLPLPSNVREAADGRMAPTLEKSMAKPKADVAAAAGDRDKQKKETLDKARADNEKLNSEARDEQKNAVLSSRQKVADQQVAGIKETQGLAEKQQGEMTAEQLTATKAVKDRVTKDNSDADTKLKEGEREAEAKREEGERDAKAKKKELEKESKSDSWWDRAVNAVKSAVKAVTKAIDVIFDKIRSAVKTLIEAAKNAALKLIEAGRKWIVDKLDRFGKWLKDKVNKYLSAFPALQKRLNAAIDATVNKAKEAVNKAAAALKKGVEALASAVAGFLDKILSVFQGLIKAAVQIVGALLTGDFAEALKIAFLAVCDVLGIDPKPILDFINRAGEQLGKIFKNTVKFFSNVARGIKMGLDLFFGNIKKHLIGGLVGWLTGSISEAGITLPTKWDVKGVFSLVMQILGLTYENIKARVIKKLGPKAAKAIDAVEQNVGLVKDLITKGPIVLWDRVKKSLAGLKEKVFGAIAKYISVTVIKEGIVWLLSLLNPAAAIVKAVKLLFDLVMFFINEGKRIAEFIKSVYNSVVELATGKLTKAAIAVESALARTVPVVISFMASLLGLGGLGKTVKNIMGTVQKPINKALDKVINFIVKKARAFIKGGKAALKKGAKKVKALLKWWKKEKSFKGSDGKAHKVFFKVSGNTAIPMVASAEESAERVFQNGVWEGIELTKEETSSLGQEIRFLKDQNKIEEKKSGPESSAVKRVNAMNRIAATLDGVLERSGKGPIPKSIVTFPGQAKKYEGGEMGTHVKAEKLSIKPPDNYRGSEPNVDVKLWSALNEQYKTGEKRKQGQFTRGHLLNHRVHGPGNETKNLTPMLIGANNRFKTEVEDKLKKQVIDEKNVVQYEAKVEYPGGTAGNVLSFAPTAIKVNLKQMHFHPKEGTPEGGEWNLRAPSGGAKGPSWTGFNNLTFKLNPQNVKDSATLPGILSKTQSQMRPILGKQYADDFVHWRDTNDWSKYVTESGPNIGGMYKEIESWTKKSVEREKYRDARLERLEANIDKNTLQPK